MQKKKIPMRQCVGCREMKPKRELIRVVRSPEGEIALDFRGKNPGRGAYICPDAKCLAKARKKNALGNAFGCQIPDEVYDQLTEQMEQNINACDIAIARPVLPRGKAGQR